MIALEHCIKCQQCDSTNVRTVSVRLFRGLVRRRRACSRGHRWTTWELPEKSVRFLLAGHDLVGRVRQLNVGKELRTPVGRVGELLSKVLGTLKDAG